MVFGLARQSTVEKKNKEIEELHDEVSEVTRQKDKLLRNYGNLKKSFSLLEKQFKTLPRDYNRVMGLMEPRIAYKATKNAVVTLILPEGTTVVFPTESAQADQTFWYNKLRCDEVIPIRFESISNNRTEKDADRGTYHSSFEYNIGVPATPRTELNTNVEKVCMSGIHIFAEKDHAKKWTEA